MGEHTRYINLVETVDEKMASPKTKKENRQIQKVHDLVHYIKTESPYISKKEKTISAPILSSPKVRNDGRKIIQHGNTLDQRSPTNYEILYPIGRTESQKTHRINLDQIID